jgi:rare lipoprotein A (peptidoglycan hydrolase)
MLMRQNGDNANRGNDRWQFWMLVTASVLALAALALTFPLRTVQANAHLSRPTAAGETVVASATPVHNPGAKKATAVEVLKEDVLAERQVPANLLHGVASWYGTVFNGRQTASGERYDMFAMTACHPTLPFGTKVRVVNVRNHKSVVVRITDRGLLYGGRVMDLSYAAARQLGMIDSGLARVNIQILKAGSPQGNP